LLVLKFLVQVLRLCSHVTSTLGDATRPSNSILHAYLVNCKVLSPNELPLRLQW